MITYDPYGNGSDGSKLVPGEMYLAKANGAPDAEGNLRESVDIEYLRYKAVINGSLFSMWLQEGTGHGYRLPQYMDFK